MQYFLQYYGFVDYVSFCNAGGLSTSDMFKKFFAGLDLEVILSVDKLNSKAFTYFFVCVLYLLCGNAQHL